MPNGDFEPMYSTNNIWYDTYTAQCLTNHLEDMGADIDTLQTGKANVNHTHNEYSPINHEHSEYALVNHSHTGYALIGHTHSYNDLEDKPVIPTTLPANGGNSDTVDGKHAADFATVESVDMLQTLVGSTSVQSQISTAVGTITPTSIGAAEEGHVHNYNDLTNKPTSLPANGGNADTVDGKHASDFATSADITMLQNLVGDTAVPTQINNAITSATSDLSDTYATKANPKFENSISMNRETWSTVGTNSIAIGNYCQASGNYSYAEGYYSEATKNYAHAEGCQTVASGTSSHAEGANTIASGYHSHAEGDETIAQTLSQHVEGAYNIPDSGGSMSRYGKYLHIAGNGSNLARSNAYTLDWDGNGWFAGTIEGTAMILKSSTPNSTKRFKITVDDSGAISTTEIN